MRKGKIVRDNIPAIIKQDTGKEPDICILEGQELVEAMLDKVIEEINGLRAARGRKSIRMEMGDVSEAVDGLMFALKINAPEVEILKRKKRARNGGFEKGIFMFD